MMLKCWRWVKSKLKKKKRQDAAATPSGVQTPSQHIADTPVPARDGPDKRIAPPTTPNPPVPATTADSTAPPLPAPSAPTTSTAQPASADSTSGLQGRLWNKAYDDLKKEEPKLVDQYERLLSRELSEGDSSSTDETCHKNEIEQTNSETRWTQMAQLVQAGLAKTEKEAAVKHAIQEKMNILSSVKDLIDTAVKSAPEAAIAWTGACFALRMLANPISETDANRDGIAYVMSKMEWYWNLSSLLFEENQFNRTAALRGELEKNIIDLYVKLLLYQMKSVCYYYRQRFVAVGRDMVKLDDWKNTLQSLKDAESTIQQDINQYNTEEIKSHLGKLVRADETRQDVQQEEKNNKCLTDLRKTDPHDDKERIKQTKGGLLEGSSNWILEHKDFQRWREEDEARVLWIKGDPGKGKTMLLITIVDELERELKQPHQQPTTILSYFFCQGTNSNLNSATSVLRGLIYRLGVQSPSLVSHLRKRYDTTGSKLFEGENAFISLSKVLRDMLQEASLSKVYIVIDALDECEQELPQLLWFIGEASSASTRVKWIVSSRNRPEIEQQLKLDNSGTKLSLELTQNAEQVSSAVNKYIDFKTLQVPSLQDDDDEDGGKRGQIREQVRKTMYEKANGTFLWVALVIKELEHPETLDALCVVKKVPTDLYALYDRILKQIQQLTHRDSCRHVLSTATLAYRPLHLAELRALSDLRLMDSGSKIPVRKIVAMCSSFLTIQDDYVYHIHQSAKDYLSSKASSAIFPSGSIDAHRAIFSRSLQAMGTLRRDMYNLHHPGRLIGEIKTPKPDPLAAIRYSCVHWIDHFCFCNGYDSNCSEVKAVSKFLREKFLYWLEALGLMRHLGDATASITKLEKLLREISTDRESLDLVQDSRRFILHNRWVIENAPLQAYASALIFSPTHSLMRNIFKDEEPHWIQLKPTVEHNWSPCLQTLEGHSNPITSVAFSYDSKLLASGLYDKTIKIWDIITGSF